MKELKWVLIIWGVAAFVAIALVASVTASIDKRTSLGIDYPGDTKPAQQYTVNPQQNINGKELQPQ